MHIVSAAVRAKAAELVLQLPHNVAQELTAMLDTMDAVTSVTELRRCCAVYKVSRRGQDKKELKADVLCKRLGECFVEKLDAAANQSQRDGTPSAISNAQVSSIQILTPAVRAKATNLVEKLPARVTQEITTMLAALDAVTSVSKLRHCCAVYKIGRRGEDRKELKVDVLCKRLETCFVEKLDAAANQSQRDGTPSATSNAQVSSIQILTPAVRAKATSLVEKLPAHVTQEITTMLAALDAVTSVPKLRHCCAVYKIGRRGQDKKELRADALCKHLEEVFVHKMDDIVKSSWSALQKKAKTIIEHLPVQLASELAKMIPVAPPMQMSEDELRLNCSTFDIAETVYDPVQKSIRAKSQAEKILEIDSVLRHVLAALDFDEIGCNLEKVLSMEVTERDRRKLKELHVTLIDIDNDQKAQHAAWKYALPTQHSGLLESVVAFSDRLQQEIEKCRVFVSKQKQDFAGMSDNSASAFLSASDRLQTNAVDEQKPKQKTLTEIFARQPAGKRERSPEPVPDPMQRTWWWERVIHQAHSHAKKETLPIDLLQKLEALKKPGRGLTYRMLCKKPWQDMMAQSYIGVYIPKTKPRERYKLNYVHYHVAADVLLQLHVATTCLEKNNAVQQQSKQCPCLQKLLQNVCTETTLTKEPFSFLWSPPTDIAISSWQFWKHLLLIECMDRTYIQLPLQMTELTDFVMKHRLERHQRCAAETNFSDDAVADVLKKYATTAMGKWFLKIVFGQEIDDFHSVASLVLNSCAAFETFSCKHFADAAHFASFLVFAYCIFFRKKQCQRINKYSAVLTCNTQYVSGQDISSSDALASSIDLCLLPTADSVAKRAMLSAPITCELCHAGFATAATFEQHCKENHGGIQEMRKRFLWMLQQSPMMPLKPWKKRSLLQNHAFFTQFSCPGSGTNAWTNDLERAMPRKEEACICCARLDFVEHRYRVYPFQSSTESTNWKDYMQRQHGVLKSQQDSEDDSEDHSLTLFSGELCFGPKKAVDAVLNVSQYSSMFPKIPKDELRASAIAHPSDATMEWLLHSRRVATVPGSGLCPIGDVNALCWICVDCAKCLCTKNPQLPPLALANGMWLGRLHPDFADLTMAEKMLQSKARLVMKKLFLRPGNRSESNSGMTGNCILIAQPSAEECLQLPALQPTLDNLAIVFCRSVQEDSRLDSVNV